ncbi:MAG TPA: GIY-YIG nuclease family protein [Acetobacteraceae bacterium]|jgi:hypothetical protein
MLYVLSNRDQSLAKIGMTRDGTPDARASDYERTHGIRWHVYWSAVTCNITETEAAAHRELDICRFALVPGAREVFHVTPAKAQRIAARYVVPPSGGAALPPGARAAGLSHGEILLAAVSPALARVATSSLRHRYGRMLSRLFSWWLASRRHRTFR